MRSLMQCLSDIEYSNNIAIFTHMAPDADALASAVALKKVIKTNFSDEKIIDIFFDYEEISEVNNAIIKGITHNFSRCNNYELGIALDCASLSRLGKYEEMFKACEKTINIDHHITNDEFAQNNLVLKTTSTCEALYLLLKFKNLTLTDDVCSLIYSGIITDTNNLTQGLITTRTYKIISEMYSRKINLDALNDHFFKNNTKNKAFLLKKALDSLKFYQEDRIAYMKITKGDLASCEATFDDTVGIVNHGIEIKGVDIAILAIKQEDDSYYVSLRGKNSINVAEIATKMGGGGHEHVAAFQYTGAYGQLFDNLIAICKEELAKYAPENIVESLFSGDDDSEL